jgi:hypothetical protein
MKEVGFWHMIMIDTGIYSKGLTVPICDVGPLTCVGNEEFYSVSIFGLADKSKHACVTRKAVS